MKKALVVIGISIIFVCLFSTDSALADGNQLLERCNALIRVFDNQNSMVEDDLLEAQHCSGFMKGVLDMNAVYSSMHTEQPLLCVPDEGVLVIKAARIVVKYLNEHPEQLHFQDGVLATLALAEAFPCK